MVIKIFRWCLTLVDRMLPCLPQEAIHALLPVKLDRITRPSLEELNAVLFTNGKIYNRPQSSDFMKAYLLDEFFRQVEPAAIQGLVTTALPRDGMAGAGVTLKSMESRSRGPREKGARY